MRDFDADRPNFKPTPNEIRMDMARWKAIIELLKENAFGCEIHIGDFKIGVCTNSDLIPIARSNIVEIQKCLDGKPNKYE